MRRAAEIALAAGLVWTGACGGDDEGEPPFAVLQEGQRAALLSVWAGGPDDVWAVGGENRTGAGDDLGPIVQHYDGTAWSELDTGERALDLWWVFGFAGGPVFLGGTGGTILRYQDGAFERMTTPGTATVFGLWGAAPDDVWAVGGILGGGGGGFAWRYDGAAWTVLDAVPQDVAQDGTVWKITGRAADDVTLCGTLGYTGHWDGGELSRADVPLDVSLFSVACDGASCYAAGGDPGVVLEDTGDGWVQSPLPDGTQTLSGVAASTDDAYAVGRTGTVFRHRAGEDGWDAVSDVPTIENLHAAAIDSEGGVWLVGGQFNQPNTEAGVLLHRAAP